MEKLDKHIEELLHNHDCVIVPEFGGFITSKMPAFYNKFTSVFHPAKKKILFNKHLVFNDGLLATQVAERKSLSVEEANQLLIQFKDDCFLRLNEEGRVEIEKVGVLFFDKEKNIQFQQSSTNFLKESFGLSTLSIEKLKEETVKPATKVVAISRQDEVKVDRKAVAIARPEKKASNRKKRRGAALLPLLIIPFVAGALFIGNQQGVIGENKINISSFNPFYSVNVEPYTPRTEKSFLAEITTEEPILVEVVTAPVEVVEATPIKEVELIPEKIDSTRNVVEIVPQELKYHIIAGCFGQQENADNLVKTWREKGNNASVVDKKGSLYRVAIQSFATRKEAKEFLKEIKKSYKNSLWVLKK